MCHVREEVLETALAARARIAQLDLFEIAPGDDPGSRAVHRHLRCIGRVDPDALEKVRLLAKRGERVGIIAGTAPRDPHAHMWKRAQPREYVGEELGEERRIGKRGARIEGERIDKALHRTRLVQHPLLQTGDRGSAFRTYAFEHAPAQCRRRILAEIMTRYPLHGFEQQLEFQVGHGRRRPVRRAQPILGDQADTFNQTRTSAIN